MVSSLRLCTIHLSSRIHLVGRVGFRPSRCIHLSMSANFVAERCTRIATFGCCHSVSSVVCRLFVMRVYCDKTTEIMQFFTEKYRRASTFIRLSLTTIFEGISLDWGLKQGGVVFDSLCSAISVK